MRGHGQGHNPVSLEDMASRGCCSRVAELGPPGPQSRGGNSVLRPRAGAQSSHPTGLPGTGSLSRAGFLAPESAFPSSHVWRQLAWEGPVTCVPAPVIGSPGFTGRQGCPANGMLQMGVGPSPISHTTTGCPVEGGGEAGECAPHSGGRRERAQSLSLSGQD